MDSFINFIIFQIKNVNKIPIYAFICKQHAVGNTKLGVFWIIIRPFFPLVSFTLVFGRFASIETNQVPYLLFVTCSFIIWSLIDDFVFWSTRSFGYNYYFIKNYKTPLLNVVIAGNYLGLMIFITYVIYFLVLILYYNLTDQNYIYFDIIGVLLSIIIFLFFSTGISIFTNVLDLKIKDVRFSTKYIFNILMFISCVLYPINYVPEKYRELFLLLNPLAAPIINFRNSIFGSNEFLPTLYLTYSFVLSIIVLLSGLYFLYKKEEAILDISR
jgi:lipopolysaccharide transport system permease protein